MSSCRDECHGDGRLRSASTRIDLEKALVTAVKDQTAPDSTPWSAPVLHVDLASYGPSVEAIGESIHVRRGAPALGGGALSEDEQVYSPT